MLTVIIPSRTEKFLQRTIEDVLEKSHGEIEVIPVVDGYWPPQEEMVIDPRVKYLHLEPQKYTQKRHGINRAVELAQGDYVMALDAHCMMAPGFDVQLIKDHEPNWVQIPRRNRLDPEAWSLQPQSDNRPPIDYEYFMYPGKVGKNGLHGFKWDERTLERWNIPIDDTIEFQGSCWFMTKEWFQRMHFMQIEGYTGWGQEAEEIGFTTRLHGGKVKTNKNTWYAHLHKGAKWGRMYYMSKDSVNESNTYCYQHWVNDNKDFFISVIESFPLMPGWPTNWKDELWK